VITLGDVCASSVAPAAYTAPPNTMVHTRDFVIAPSLVVELKK